MRRWQKVSVGVVGTFGVLLAAAYGYHRYRMAKMMELVDELPTFTEPASGAKAPTARAFDFELGASQLSDVQSALATLSLNCADTSMRSMMDAARDAKRKEIEDAKASGAGADSVTGASMIYRRSRKERNPQVRLSCIDATADKLKDRPRQGTGRLLLIFDSAQHPLRHVSYTRSFAPSDDSTARSEFLAASASMTKSYGPPAKALSDEVKLPLARYQSYSLDWNFSDVRASLRLMNMGNGSLSLDETIEVPWPVRADAPQLKRRT